mgnify:CR=1 FL=1
MHFAAQILNTEFVIRFLAHSAVVVDDALRALHIHIAVFVEKGGRSPVDRAIGLLREGSVCAMTLPTPDCGPPLEYDEEVAQAAVGLTRLPKDIEAGLAETAVFRVDVENFPNGCHICEVEIDRDTGATEIVRYTVVDDVGTVLNPMLLHGQIHGGVVQGIGQVLKEDIRFDSDGQMLTGSFMDYAMPRAHDLCAIRVAANPVPTRQNPLGVKGAGEAGGVGALPAVANAIVDALTPFGVSHIEMPATPERVWRAIQG